MTAASEPIRASRPPLSERQRYQVATATSLVVHVTVLLLIGLLTLRPAVRPEVLIPIELTVSEQPESSLELGGRGRPEAKAPPSTIAPVSPKLIARPASNAGGPAKAAPAPPRLLTSKKGTEPAGATGQGRAAAGPGGKAEVPAGPTRGPGIVGGPTPVYPKDALDEGVEGTVSLEVSTTKDGAVANIKVAKSSGSQLLDDAAMRAVTRGWTFQPALQRGVPTTGAITVTFVFSAGAVHSP